MASRPALDRRFMARRRWVTGLLLLPVLLWMSCARPALGATGAASPPPGGTPARPDATPADVPVRFAIHDGFDRLVLSLPPGSRSVSSQTGDVVTIRVAGAGRIVAEGLSGRRLRTITGAQGTVTLQLAPGTRLRTWRLDNRLVIDLLDPPAHHGPLVALPALPTAGVGGGRAPAAPNAKVVAATTPTRPKPSAEPPRSLVPPPSPSLGKALPPAGSGSGAAPAANPSAPPMPPPPKVESVQATPLPRPAPSGDAAPAGGQGAALLLPPDSALPGAAISLPLGRDVGAAAFERAGEGHVVFDAAQPVDLSALRDDPVFGGTTEQVLPDGMHLRLRLAQGAQLRLFRRGEIWALAVVPAGGAAPPLTPLSGHLSGGVLKVDARAPGHVVILDDSATGARLLVGTQLVAGQRMASAHVAPDFILPSTWQGMVVEPASDRLLLRSRSTGFELSATGAPPLAASWSEHVAATWPEGRAMTRMFDLPDLPAEDLARRLGQAMRDAAVTPRPARYKPRLAVAQAMLAQGMDVEAAAVLHAAAADDPSHRDDSMQAGLSAIAAWLSAMAGGAPPPALAFDPKVMGGSDEAALWRALLDPTSPDMGAQASAVAATWPMVLAYPPGLRRLMLRPVAALLQGGGQDKALAAFLAAYPDPALDLARAGLLQRQGKTDEALALLDRVANRPDRLARAEALEQAVELRLATRRLEPNAAADALDKQIYAWRGGDRELRLRLRVAQLRQQAGAWRVALAALRETATLFPQAQTEIRAAEVAVVSDLLRGEGATKLSALDLVALADEASGLLTKADAESSLAPVLVDKLLALDLPGRAEPVLRRLFDGATQDTAKAEIGVRLAGLVADRGDTAGALAVLGSSTGDGLASSLVSKRAILRARLLAKAGKPAEALQALAGQHGYEVGDLQATIMESQHDWAGAAGVLNAGVQDPAFSNLPAPAQRSLVLRVARDESEAGDMAGLHRLRETQRDRLKSGPGAELFDVLTAEPVRTANDLPRSAAELASMRVLPAALSHNQPF